MRTWLPFELSLCAHSRMRSTFDFPKTATHATIGDPRFIMISYSVHTKSKGFTARMLARVYETKQ